MKNVITIVCVFGLVTLGCGEEPIDQPTAESNRSSTSAQSTADSNKADSAEKQNVEGETNRGTASDDDACAYFQFYNDGKCDRDCRNPDPDCAQGAAESDQLDFLCGHVEGPNGVCLPGCGSLDPDCDGQEEEVESQPECAETFSDLDGRCDENCFPQDEDCLARNDVCYDEYRYADGTCDTNCNFVDPDCSDEPLPSGILTVDEEGVCGRFLRNEGPDLARELATSLCIERQPSELPNCIAACMNVSF